MIIILFSLQYVTAKLLVVTGAPAEIGMNSEVIAIGDKHASCKIPYTNTFGFFDGFGALVQNEILVCPGWKGDADEILNQCWILSNTRPRMLTLLDGRVNAASIVVGPSSESKVSEIFV